MKKKISTTCFVFLIIISVQAQDYKGFTLEESKTLHDQFSLDNWASGGGLSRYVFLNMSEFWHHTVIDRTGPIKELSLNLREDIAKFITQTSQGAKSLQDYVRNSTVDGVVIVHKSKIVFEDYPRMFSYDKHNYMSISKTFASTLVAILEDRGQIDVKNPIESYFSELKGTAWEEIQVIDILDMSSGIDCLELKEGVYSDPNWLLQKKLLNQTIYCIYPHTANS